MNRPCAYCKELGHHIKACSLLAEKNRKQDTRTVKTVSRELPNTRKPEKKNMFVDLYSSSSEDEVEEGEIVEEFRRTSDSENSSVSSSETNWSRSGTRTTPIYIPYPKVDTDDCSLDDDYVPPVYNYVPFEFCQTCKGMSWADIEYCSDCE
jgi:hypothetical protein